MSQIRSQQSRISKQPKETQGLSLEQLDGRHPFQLAAPNSYVLYRTRKRRPAKVVYFNFDLAREMGILPKTAPAKMTKEIESDLIDNFSIQIINEYDIANQTPIAAQDIRPGFYMATRYLQLQHPKKNGSTSGDGRAIWNGTLKGPDQRQWDIMSTGTGATCLSPACAIEQKHFKTGDPTVSYGCGYASVEDGLGAALMSEIVHQKGIKTERVLAIIESAKGISINVRAYPNLLRPSHFLRLYKLKQFQELKSLFEHYTEREVKNGGLPGYLLRANRPSEKAKQIINCWIENFAKAAARFESYYLFVWMDWDGDNILMDGGIIDYGSVRRMGAYYRDYQFDDDTRWSSKLGDQKWEALKTVLRLTQAYTKAFSLKPVWSDKMIKSKFIEVFKNEKRKITEERAGLRSLKTDHVRRFQKEIEFLESIQSHKGLVKSADGITSVPVFSVPKILSDFSRGEFEALNSWDKFTDRYALSGALKRDLKSSPRRTQALSVLRSIAKRLKRQLRVVPDSVSEQDYLTGDGALFSSSYLNRMRNQLGPESVYRVIQAFFGKVSELQNLSRAESRALRKIQDLAKQHQHSL